MKKNKPSPLEAALKEACRESPLDPAPRRVHADWLEEQGGRDREARRLREKAARCESYDPDFDYEARLGDLDLPEEWGVAVFPLGASGFVWVCGEDEQEAFCEAPELQAWLLEQAGEGPLPDPETFWEDVPALSRPPREALKALFQAGEGRQEFYWVDGPEDWAGSWNGTVVREVGEGHYLEKSAGGGWGMLDKRRFEGLMSEGYLVARLDWEEARRDA
jgi:uncharacterized protein (TIGR02996 family)